MISGSTSTSGTASDVEFSGVAVAGGCPGVGAEDGSDIVSGIGSSKDSGAGSDVDGSDVCGVDTEAVSSERGSGAGSDVGAEDGSDTNVGGSGVDVGGSGVEFGE